MIHRRLLILRRWRKRLHSYLMMRRKVFKHLGKSANRSSKGGRVSGYLRDFFLARAFLDLVAVPPRSFSRLCDVPKRTWLRDPREDRRVLLCALPNTGTSKMVCTITIYGNYKSAKNPYVFSTIFGMFFMGRAMFLDRIPVCCRLLEAPKYV